MNKNRMILGGSIIVLLCLSYLGSKIYVDSRLNLIQVPVASKTITPRTKLTESDFVMIKMPKAYLQETIVLDPKELIDKYTLVSSEIPAGSVFYASMIESLENAKDYPSLLLKEKQVVYALDVDLKMTSGNTLQPFQKIDLYVALVDNHLTIVDRLIANVRILSLKDKNGKDIEKASDVPKIMLIALDQALVSLLTKSIELGELIITPISKNDTLQECILIENTTLLKVLYER